MGQGTHKRAESRFVVRHHDQDRAGIQAHGPYPGGAAPGKIVGDRRQLLGGEKCSHPIGDPDDQQRVGRPGGGIGGREGGGRIKEAFSQTPGHFPHRLIVGKNNCYGIGIQGHVTLYR